MTSCGCIYRAPVECYFLIVVLPIIKLIDISCGLSGIFVRLLEDAGLPLNANVVNAQ